MKLKMGLESGFVFAIAEHGYAPASVLKQNYWYVAQNYNPQLPTQPKFFWSFSNLKTAI